MAYRVDEVIRKTVGTTAETIQLGYTPVYIENAGSTTLYIKEAEWDGTDCTPQNGFPIVKGCMIQKPLAIRKLSVVSSAAGGGLAIMKVQDYI